MTVPASENRQAEVPAGLVVLGKEGGAAVAVAAAPEGKGRRHGHDSRGRFHHPRLHTCRVVE